MGEYFRLRQSCCGKSFCACPLGICKKKVDTDGLKSFSCSLPRCSFGFGGKPIGCAIGDTCATSLLTCCFPEVSDPCQCSGGCCQLQWSAYEDCLTANLCGVCKTFVAGGGGAMGKERWTTSWLPKSKNISYSQQHKYQHDNTIIDSEKCNCGEYNCIVCNKQISIKVDTGTGSSDIEITTDIQASEHIKIIDISENENASSIIDYEETESDSQKQEKIEHTLSKRKLQLIKGEEIRVRWSIQEEECSTDGTTKQRYMDFPGLSDPALLSCEELMEVLHEHRFTLSKQELTELLNKYKNAQTQSTSLDGETSVVAEIQYDM